MSVHHHHFKNLKHRMGVITFEVLIGICCFLGTSKGEMVPVHVLKAWIHHLWTRSTWVVIFIPWPLKEISQHIEQVTRLQHRPECFGVEKTHVHTGNKNSCAVIQPIAPFSAPSIWWQNVQSVVVLVLSNSCHHWRCVINDIFTSSLLGMCSGDGQFRSQPRDWLCLGS